VAEEEEKPRRRRRRGLRGRESAGGPEAESPATEAGDSTEADAEGEADEVEPTPADIEAEDATEVVLESDDEAEGEATGDEAEGEPSDDAADEHEPEAGADEADEDADEDEDEGEDEEADEDEDEDEDDGDEAAPAQGRARRRLRRPGRARRQGKGAAEEKPARPAPARRRRSQRDPNLPPPVVRAQAKYVRSSARKARLVCDHIRGKSVDEARAILALTPRAVASDWSKLLESAVANAEHNHELVGEDLYLLEIYADEGPTIKRFRPRALGRATKIRKRTSHLTILLTPKE
jgi:ribosomal protein L22